MRQTNTLKYYGTAGLAYLEKLVNDKQDLGGLLESALVKFISEDMQPQEKRAARAFALVAVAGELATDYSVTGWSKGEATKAVIQCFEQWRLNRGAGTTEDNSILKSIQDFIDGYEDARFTSISTNDQVNGKRAGWHSGVDVDPKSYYFTATGLSDAAAGYDLKRVIEALIKDDWLTLATDGKPKKQVKIQGKNGKYYVITPKQPIEEGNPSNAEGYLRVTATGHATQGGNRGNPSNPENNINQVKNKVDTVRI